MVEGKRLLKMAIEAVQPLDMWNLFVVSVFGGFWIAVIGLILLFFIIMGPLGKISIYTVMQFCMVFVLAISIGYGYVFISLLINFAIILFFYFSAKSYIDSR